MSDLLWVCMSISLQDVIITKPHSLTLRVWGIAYIKRHQRALSCLYSKIKQFGIHYFNVCSPLQQLAMFATVAITTMKMTCRNCVYRYLSVWHMYVDHNSKYRNPSGGFTVFFLPSCEPIVAGIICPTTF